MRVVVYQLRGNAGAAQTCPAITQGIPKAGDQVVRCGEDAFHPDHPHNYDAAVFWGYTQPMQDIAAAYRAVGKPFVYMDMGYWHRHKYYKVAINARHPTAYFQKIPRDPSRRNVFGVSPTRFTLDESTGDCVLIAGMGAKAAWAEKEEPVESWERKTVAALRELTDRPIIYRPKPSWRKFTPIEGTTLSMPTEPLGNVLVKTWAVVTHHSNVGVDALLLGVPVFTWAGAAYPLALQDLQFIEVPKRPALVDVMQWANDLAYCQWSLDEMRDGSAWRYLKEVINGGYC